MSCAAFGLAVLHYVAEIVNVKTLRRDWTREVLTGSAYTMLATKQDRLKDEEVDVTASTPTFENFIKHFKTIQQVNRAAITCRMRDTTQTSICDTV